MTLTVQHAPEFVYLYGYILVFAIVFLDQAIISLPSPPFVVAMGALTASGHFQLWLAVAVILAAACLADSSWFRIGRSRRLMRLRHFIEGKIKTRTIRHPSALGYGTLGGLLGVKFSLVPSFLAPLIAGTTQLTNVRFAAFAATANLIWTLVFFFTGFIGASKVALWIGTLFRAFRFNT